MNQLTWIAAVVLISICSAKMTMANVQDLSSNSTEFIATPILFRSDFMGRSSLALRQELPIKEDLTKESIIVDKKIIEKNPEEAQETDQTDETAEGNSRESRYKKNVSDESDSDESDSDESDSDEKENPISAGEKEDERSSKPSRWLPTRFGSSFWLQAVRSPINHRRTN